MRILFVTNYCPRYRVDTFEVLARRADVEYAFFSKGDEWFWDSRHGFHAGAFKYRRLSGCRIGGLQVNPGLLWLVFNGGHDVYIKDIDGPIAVLVTLAGAKVRRRPFVLWTGMWQHPRSLFHRISYPATRLLYRMADAIVVYGDHVKSYLMSIGVDEKKVFIAPHALDNREYAVPVSPEDQHVLRQRLGIGDRRVVLYVGRLEAVKGLDVLLRAFAVVRSSETVLVCVGDGSLRGGLAQLGRRLGIEQDVVFTGFASQADVVALYATAEVLVLPSVSVRSGKETWGLVVNEAMNQGTPVIATTAVGAAMGGLIQPGRNGEVVREGDVTALSEAIARVLSSKAYRDRLSQGARDTIATWDNEQMVEGFLDAVRYATTTRGRF